MSRFFPQRFLPLVSVALLTACATNPVTGEREFSLMSEEQEIATGQQLDPEIRREMGEYPDRAIQEYVEGIGLKLARASQRPDLPWHFTVVDATAVNAFALPGGYIYITRGLLAYLRDEAELAGVLGHEIGHVTARHAARQYSRATGAGVGLAALSIFFPGAQPVGDLANLGAGLLFLKYGRNDELQADRLGAEYAAGNGWDPRGVPDLLNTLARIDALADRRGVPSYLATHPDPLDRVERIQPVVQQLEAGRAEPNWAVNERGFLGRLDGLVFGDNPRDGVLRGREFVHPELRLGLTFPAGWEVTNTAEQVVAQQPGENAFLLMDLVQQPRGRSLEEIGVASMRASGFRQRSGDMASINGLSAFVGTFQGNLAQIGAVQARAAFIESDRRVFRIIGFAPAQLFDRIAADIADTHRSFRGLSPAEAAGIRPNRLAFHTVRAGDTWQSIAEGPSQGNVRSSTLAIMNGRDPNEQPVAGDRVKIVVSS